MLAYTSVVLLFLDNYGNNIMSRKSTHSVPNMITFCEWIMFRFLFSCCFFVCRQFELCSFYCRHAGGRLEWSQFCMCCPLVCLFSIQQFKSWGLPSAGWEGAHATISSHSCILLYRQVQCYPPLWQLHSDFRDTVCDVRKRTMAKRWHTVVYVWATGVPLWMNDEEAESNPNTGFSTILLWPWWSVYPFLGEGQFEPILMCGK